MCVVACSRNLRARKGSETNKKKELTVTTVPEKEITGSNQNIWNTYNNITLGVHISGCRNVFVVYGKKD